MRYAIGVKMVERDGKIADGLYVYGKGLQSFVMTDSYNPELNKTRIPIFTDRADAQKCISSLIRRHRKIKKAYKKKCDTPQYNFFLLKVDSSKFQYVLKTEYQMQPSSLYPSRKCYFLSRK